MTQTSSGKQNYGGNAVRAVQDGTSVNVAKGANVTITGGKNVRGIYAGADKLTGALDGLVNVDGNLTENMGAGHSTAINAGNLTVGSTGKIDITTAQDNNQGLVGNLTFNGNHYGVIALGVGHLQGTYSSDKNTLTDNGSIKINRTATGKLSAPLIAFGGGGVTGNYELTVNNGATLDLQDAADQESSDHAGMIVMFGTSSDDVINFNNPTYVNLQRTAGKGSGLDNVTGNFITTQGTTNSVNITGTTPVAQWDEGNVSSTPSFVWSINNQKTMSNWGTDSYTFTPSGKSAPQAGEGETKLMHSNGTVIMGANQAGKDSFKFDDGTTVLGTPDYANKGEYYAPYLNSYLNNFSWWTPQRLTMGSASYLHQADEYQPEVQTIHGTTSQTLSDLQAKDGIKDLITQDDSTLPLPSDATVTWYNPSTDAGTWTTVMGSRPVPTIPTGNLKTTDTSAWAKVTYGDGSVDFVNIPLNITDSALPELPSTKTDADQNDPKGQDVSTTVGTVPAAKDGVQWPTGQPQDVNGNPITLSDSNYTWAQAPDVNNAGVVPGIVNITYPDGSKDQVAVNVIVKDASGNVPTTDPTKDNGKYDPQGKTVTTTIGTQVDPSTTIDWPNGAPEDGTPTYTWSTMPDVYSQGQHPGVVKVVYGDGTSELVPVKVDVTNAPSGKNTTVPQGGTLPDPSSVINWGTNPDDTPITAPTGAHYEWTDSPDTSTVGTKNGVVTITYPNGEKTEVVVPVTVTPTSTTNAYDSYVEPQQYAYSPSGEGVPSDPTLLVNLPTGENAPAGVHYKRGTKPDTTKANTTQQAKVIATYPDPNDGTKNVTKTIQVIAHIGSMADYYKAKAKANDLTVPYDANDANMDDYPASDQISISDPSGHEINDPSSVVSYDAWAPTPVTIVSGTQPTMIKVTYKDGSWDYVPLNVIVGPKSTDTLADQYPVSYNGIDLQRPTDDSPASNSADPQKAEHTPANAITGYRIQNGFDGPQHVTVYVNPRTSYCYCR